MVALFGGVVKKPKLHRKTSSCIFFEKPLVNLVLVRSWRKLEAYSYFEKGCRKNVHATIPKGNMGYDQYTVPDTAAVEPTFFAFL